MVDNKKTAVVVGPVVAAEGNTGDIGQAWRSYLLAYADERGGHVLWFAVQVQVKYRMRARSCVVVAACRTDGETDDCDRVTVITSWIYNVETRTGYIELLDWLVGWADIYAFVC